MMTSAAATNQSASNVTYAKQWLLYKRQHWDAKKTSNLCQLEEEL